MPAASETPRRLPEPLVGWRIGDPDGRFPVFSAEGAALWAGRWHAVGQRVIYASERNATAMLEKLAHCNGILPPNQHAVEITLPNGSSYEVVSPERLPAWHEASGESARRFGMRWYEERRSLVLIVPSVVARAERNLVINAEHPEFAGVRRGLEAPVWWDTRLFD